MSHPRYTSLGEFIDEDRERREALKSLFISQNPPFLFVGSGVDIGVHSGWAGFIDQILSHCGQEKSLDGQEETQPQRAERAKNADLERYKEAILGEFAHFDTLEQKVVGQLGKLNVRGVVTTNYGDALHRTFESRHFTLSVSDNVFRDYVYLMDTKGTGVFYIHGHIREGQNQTEPLDIALATSEYAEYYKEDSNLRAFLQQLFTRETIVFIATGLSEDDPFPDMLRQANQRLHPSPGGVNLANQKMFALLKLPLENIDGRITFDLPAINSDEQRFFGMGVTPIWYDGSNRFKHFYTLVQSLIHDLGDIQGISENGGEPPLTTSRL